MDFYNPASIGADALSSATLIGSNALIRRAALTSIGGYQPGLAEDLATSIAVHAAGWRSAYVPEPLAPGIAPPDLPAWFTQQLKWARGVFELLLTAYSLYFTRLRTGQRLSYAVRMTYYWVGPVVCIHLLLTLAVLLSGSAQAIASYNSYLVHLLPLAIMTFAIRNLALRRWRHPALAYKWQWKSMVLVYATWPIYTLAWGMAILRLPLSFRPTPKKSRGGLNPLWLLPQIVSVVLLGLGLGLAYHTLLLHQAYLVLGFAIVQSVLMIILLGQLFLSTLTLKRFDAFIYRIVTRSSVYIQQEL